MNALRKSSYVDRHRTKRSHERRAERFEHYVGLLLRFLQCLTCNKTADFRNQGELSEFARHFVSVGPVHVFVHKLLRMYVHLTISDMLVITTEECKCFTDHTIVSETAKFNQLRNVMCDIHVNVRTRIKLLESCVRSRLINGTEAWYPKEQEIK